MKLIKLITIISIFNILVGCSNIATDAFLRENNAINENVKKVVDQIVSEVIDKSKEKMFSEIEVNLTLAYMKGELLEGSGLII